MGDDFRLVGRGVGSDRVDHLLGEHDLGQPGAVGAASPVWLKAGWTVALAMRAGESLQAATSKVMTDSAAKHDALQRYIPEDAKGKSKGKGMEVCKGQRKAQGCAPQPLPASRRTGTAGLQTVAAGPLPLWGTLQVSACHGTGQAA